MMSTVYQNHSKSLVLRILQGFSALKDVVNAQYDYPSNIGIDGNVTDHCGRTALSLH